MKKSYGNFKNFWYYNKWIILGVVIITALISVSFVQCSQRREPDLGIFCVSEEYVSDGEELIQKLSQAENLKTYWKNDPPYIFFDKVHVESEPGSQQEMGVNEKMQIQFAAGDMDLYILDSETIYYYEQAGSFFDLTDIADEFNIPENERYIGSDGKVCAISVENNSLIEESGLGGKEMYVAVRNHLPEKHEEFEIAIEAMKYILTNK